MGAPGALRLIDQRLRAFDPSPGDAGIGAPLQGGGDGAVERPRLGPQGGGEGGKGQDAGGEREGAMHEGG